MVMMRIEDRMLQTQETGTATRIDPVELVEEGAILTMPVGDGEEGPVEGEVEAEVVEVGEVGNEGPTNHLTM